MVKIDKDRYVGCGICVNICPQGFKIVNRKARIEDENASCITEAANSCPRGAIILEENKNQEESSTRQLFRPGFINGIGSNFERSRILEQVDLLALAIEVTKEKVGENGKNIINVGVGRAITMNDLK